MSDASKITGLLNRLHRVDEVDRRRLLDDLMPLVYAELKLLARSNRYRWRGPFVHGTTSLVHEAYAKLARSQVEGFAGRGQFFALASSAMRSILIDNARWHGRRKRGGAGSDVSTQDVELVSAERSAELLALDDALRALEKRRPALARVVECRIFGGLTVEEAAEGLDISPATVKRRWSLAKSWLYRELRADGESRPSDG